MKRIFTLFMLLALMLVGVAHGTDLTKLKVGYLPTDRKSVV